MTCHGVMMNSEVDCRLNALGAHQELALTLGDASPDPFPLQHSGVFQAACPATAIKTVGVDRLYLPVNVRTKEDIAKGVGDVVWCVVTQRYLRGQEGLLR